MSVKIWAVVPCAGRGQRMESSIPKQYLKIQGSAILDHTIAMLLKEDRIQQVVVSLASDDTFWNDLDCTDNSKITTTVGGGTRGHSVLNGINFLMDVADDQDWVLVHDAARPCLPSELLASFIDTLVDDEVGGILAVRCRDTIKLATQASTDHAEIKETLDRNVLWAAQTPQMFRYGLIKEALTQGLARKLTTGAEITDEASAMELAGHRVRLVEGNVSNIKITTPDDLQLATFLLQK